MSGKAYTMSELKTIVEYLKEKEAYGEIKGRKMWVDFEGSRITKRTWQSLKETFLKRILPDIHNPYYKLSPEEIASFRVGYSMIKNKSPKLKVTTTENKKTRNNGDIKNGEPKKIKIVAEVKTGEKIENKDTARASVDTLVLDKDEGYKNVEDIMRDLMSSDSEQNHKPTTPKRRNIKDAIRYSEPLSPTIQHILHDFESDETNCSASPNCAKENDVNKENEIDDVPVTSNKKIVNTTTKKALNSIRSSLKANKKDNEGKTSKRKSVDINNDNSDKITKTDNSKEVISQISNKSNRKVKSPNLSKDGKTLLENTESSEIIPSKDQEVLDTNSNTDVRILPKKLTRSKRKNELTENSNGIATKDTISAEVYTKEEPKKTGRNSKSPTINNSDDVIIQTIEPSNEISLPNNQEALKTKANRFSKSSDSEIKAIRKTPRKRVLVDSDTSVNQKEDKRHQETAIVNISDTSDSHIDNKRKPPKRRIKSKKDFRPNENSSNESSDNSTENRNRNRDISVEVHQEIIPDEKPSNPCLHNVSLFEEKLLHERENSASATNNNSITTSKEILLLKSHSESRSSSEVEAHSQAVHIKRSQVLSSLFGFSNGGGTASNFHKRGSHYRSKARNVSESSEWTSDSDTDFVPPPKIGRRHPCRYLRPGSKRIMNLENDGGLFITNGNKLYPIIRDTKSLRGFCKYTDSVGDESYWKEKYMAQKKRNAELARLLDDHNNIKKPKYSSSPTRHYQNMVQNKARSGSNNEMSKQIIAQDKDIVMNNLTDEAKNNLTDKDEKTLRLKFVKDNQEITLEGLWQNIQPIFPEIFSMFQNTTNDNVKSTETDVKAPKMIPLSNSAIYNNIDDPKQSEVSKPSITLTAPSPKKKQKRRNLSPDVLDDSNDEDVRKKVDRIEEEIFKQIQEIDRTMSESIHAEGKDVATADTDVATADSNVSAADTNVATEDVKVATTAVNVAKRKKRACKKVPSDAVERKPESDNEIIFNEDKTKLLATDQDTPSYVMRRRQKKTDNESKENKDDVESINTIPIKVANAKISAGPNETLSQIDNSDDSIRYKLALEPNEKKRRQAKKSKNRSVMKIKIRPNKSRKDLKRASKTNYLKARGEVTALPHNSSFESAESNEHYRDTDFSPVECHQRRRRAYSLTLSNHRAKSYVHRDNTTRTNRKRSFILLPLKYTSDASYDGISAIKQSEINNLTHLENFDDDYESEHERLIMNLSPASQLIESENGIDEKIYELEDESGSYSVVKAKFNNSSNPSLPTSEEISIIENFSISKEFIENLSQINFAKEEVSKPDVITFEDVEDMSITSGVNINLPVIDDVTNKSFQRESNHNMETNVCSESLESVKINNILNAPTETPVSDSFIARVNSVDITGLGASETLNDKMSNLILDSAIKSHKADSLIINDESLPLTSSVSKVNRRKMSTSRCSTPQRKGKAIKTKVLAIDNVIDEYKEYYSKSKGRRSCPPSIISTIDQETEITFQNGKQDCKKKKEIIKVKILKPTRLSSSQGNSPKKCKKSFDSTGNYTNDTESGVFVTSCDNSVDLIHNHSDTCIQTNECLQDDSVILINENQSPNVVSVESSPLKPAECTIEDETNLHDSIENRASSESQYATPKNTQTATDGVSLNNSLLTDDLSDEISKLDSQQAKWFLFSDDENSNTCFKDLPPANNTSIVHSEYMKQLFPVTCVVPNLSTITESSRDVDTENGLNNIELNNNVNNSTAKK